MSLLNCARVIIRADDSTPAPGLGGLDNTPVVPQGVITPLNNILGIMTFGVLAIAVIALLAVFGMLIMSAMGRGGTGLENLVRGTLKVFIGALGATSVLSIFTLVTGGF